MFKRIYQLYGFLMFVPVFSTKTCKANKALFEKGALVGCNLFFILVLKNILNIYIITIYDKGINQNIFQRSTRLPKCSNYVEHRLMRRSVKSPAKRSAVFVYLPTILK